MSHIKSKHPMLVLTLLVMVCVFLSGCGEKQQEKVYRVGILSGLDPLVSIADSFKAKMTELGYIEGKNISYNIQKTNFEPDKEKQILKKFVDDNVDLIFAFPTEASLEAKAATQGTGIPVVFSFSITEGNNLVDSVQNPGGYITGVREPGSDVSAKRLEILHELVPQAKRVYITYNPNVPPVPPALNALREISLLMNITLVENPVTTVEEIKADLQARNKSGDIGIDAILMMGDPVTTSFPALEAIIKFANEHKVPVGGLGRHSIREEWGGGILFGYELELDDMGRLAAPLADKILKGITAGTIPVVTPEPHLQINYKVAQELGLNVSEGLLAMADEVIR